MGSLLQNGKQQWIDQNGFPLVGGSVFFYAPGTENPMTTWKDSALSIPNANPVVLDSRGQAVVWGSGSYRQVVLDVNGVQIWDQVTIDPSATATLLTTNLAAGGGALLVGFTQTGAGALTRTVQDELREMVKPQQFMTSAQVNNVYLRLGTIDVSGAIQKAITAAGGGIVNFPSGYYGLTAGVTISDSTVLRSAGRNSAVLVPNGTFDAFTFIGGTQGAGMSGFGWNCSAHTGNAVVVNTSDRTTFRDMVLNSPYNGFYVKKANVCSLDNVWANGLRGQYGIQWYGDASNRSDVLDLNNVVVSGSGTATAASPVGLIIDGNVNTADIRHFAATNVLRGIHVRNTSGGPAPQFVTAYDVQVDFPYGEAIRGEGAARSLFFESLYAHGSIAADGVYFDSTVQNAHINGGQVDSNFLRGLNFQGRYLKARGVNVSTNSKSGSAQYPGIELGAASIGCQVLGGLSGQWIGYSAETQSYGVLIDAGAQAYSVVGVDLRNNVTGDYIDGAQDGTSVVFGNAMSSSSVNTLTGPIRSMTGDMVINGAATNAVKLGNATNGVGFAAQPSAPSSVNYPIAFGNAAGSSPALQAAGTDTNISLQLLAKGTGTLIAGATLAPTVDNSFALGSASNRWSTVWAANGSIQTSDENHKTDIADSALGLDFIKQLRPVSYRMKVGGVDVIEQQWIDENGNQVASGAPIPDNATPGGFVTKERAGVRTHWGLLSQQVKAVADSMNVDFGGHIQSDLTDPASIQGLRYEEFIAPIIRALHEISSAQDAIGLRLDSIESKSN